MKINTEHTILGDMYQALFLNFKHGVSLMAIFDNHHIDHREGRAIAERMQQEGLIKTRSLSDHSLTGRGIVLAEQVQVAPADLIDRCRRARRQILGLAAAARRKDPDFGRIDYDGALNLLPEPKEFADMMFLTLLEMGLLDSKASRSFFITRTGLAYYQGI